MLLRAVFAITFVFAVTASRAHAGAMFTWGARLSSPQLLSASAGFLIGPLDAPPRPADAPPPERMFIPRGLLLQIEPGVGGGKVGIGFAKGLLNVGGAGIKAFYLRTWGQPVWVDGGRDYAGVEADATLFLKLSLGVMRSIDGGPRDTAVTGGIGIGF